MSRVLPRKVGQRGCGGGSLRLSFGCCSCDLTPDMLKNMDWWKKTCIKKNKKNTHMAWGIGKKENAPEIVFYCVMAWLVYKRCISKYKQPESNMFAAVCHCTITVWQARGGHSWKQIGKQMVSPQCLMDHLSDSGHSRNQSIACAHTGAVSRWD